jgi:3',5'-cyclic AMP phosphodiesterase CpdA
MRNTKKIAAWVLTLALLVSAVLAGPMAGGAAGTAFKDITLQPGGDETTMNFCWHSVSGSSPAVQLAAGAGQDGTLPAGYITFKGTAASATKGWYTDKVTVTGLAPETEYVYMVANGTETSGVFTFTTGSASSYGALFLSDAQIGASGSVSADKAAWENTLANALGRYPGTSLILSGGDQVDYYLESEYDAFLASPLLRSYPIAPAVGNHENLGSSALHASYYNEPNESATAGVTNAGGDYWFKYGNTLYIVLNTNNTNAAQHDGFIGKAIAADPGRTWTVLMFHQSVYSSAQYASSSSTLALRKSLVPVIDKYDIDVVLSGHDHCYTRTYQMLGGSPAKAQTTDALGRAVNPTGTVYITSDSASGSKYYDMKTTPEPYAAVRLQPGAPTFTALDVAGGVLTMTTYRADTMAVIDTYSIVKQTASGFLDVPDGMWYTDAVAYLARNNITGGTSETTFSPDMVLTRGQCLVLLMKAYGLAPDPAGSPNFADAGNTWYTGYLAAAKRLGLAGGTGGNKFLPDARITRQDMAVLIFNTLTKLDRLPAGSASVTYSDAGKIAAYAKDAVSALTAAGVFAGSGGRFDPLGMSTRAQMAQVLYRLLANG